MLSITEIRKITNLNHKKVTIYWKKIENKRIILKIRWKYTTTCCPYCKEKTSKRQDQDLHQQKKLIPHMPYGWNKMIFLELYKRYFRCTKCNKKFYEKFDFESDYWLYSNDFEKYIQWNWWFVSWNKLAELYQTSVSTIYSILRRIDPELINTKGLEIISELEEIYLWVDEHSFSGHDMVLIITELKTWQLLAVLDWITKDKLKAWIDKIPLKDQKKIKWFSTDMNKGYANTLKDIFWKPIHTVDKMHLFMESNRMVDEVKNIARHVLEFNLITEEEANNLGSKALKDLSVEDVKKLNKSKKVNNSRIKAMKKYKDKAEQRLQLDNPLFVRNSKWEKVEYKEITPEYFVENSYFKLVATREKNLSELQRRRLTQIFFDYDYLWFIREAWVMKEDFMDAIDNLNLKEIDRIKQECLNSNHYRIRQFWKTLKRWYEGIRWYILHSTEKFKFTNALTESFNNLCKVVKRVSHGFKLKDMYIRKITARFCLKTLEI